MESYNKWRKMLFDILRCDDFIYLFDNDERKISSDTIVVPREYSSNQHKYGICSYNTNSIKEYRNVHSPMGFFAGNIPSTTFRTADIYRDENLRNELLVVHTSTNLCSIESFAEEVIITIEGLMLIHGDKKKKFLFFDDGYDTEITFSTFHELATHGYKFYKSYLTLKSTVDKNYFSSALVAENVRANTYGYYLKSVLPKLLELVKENEDLYEDAIDEICEKYPQGKK